MFERVVRRLVRQPGRVPGFVPLVRRLRSRSLAIVMYHGVTTERLTVANWCQLSLERFEEQLEFLAQ